MPCHTNVSPLHPASFFNIWIFVATDKLGIFQYHSKLNVTLLINSINFIFIKVLMFSSHDDRSQLPGSYQCVVWKLDNECCGTAHKHKLIFEGYHLIMCILKLKLIHALDRQLFHNFVAITPYFVQCSQHRCNHRTWSVLRTFQFCGMLPCECTDSTNGHWQRMYGTTEYSK